MVCKIFRQNQQEGQAMVEFVLGLMIVISFFFFYVRMCAVFAIGNYIHYATFMAARTLSSSAATASAQEEKARAVMQSMVVGHFKKVIKGEGDPQIGPGDFAKEEPLQDSWNQGVSYHFKSKLSLYPWNQQNQSIELDLTSNSWMPREESVEECKSKKSKVQSYISQMSGLKNIQIEWDNGGADGC